MKLARLSTAVSLLAVVALQARAMTVVKRDFPALVARAEQIVIGTVTDVSHEVDAAGSPSTLVTFSDLVVLKGSADNTVTLRLYGGPTGNVVIQVPDMPQFTTGERDVLFIAGNGRDVCPLVGVWQGRFRVQFDAALGMDVIADSTGTPVLGLAGRELVRATRDAAVGHAAAPQNPIGLDEFRQLIADELAHPQPAAE